jgi:hypothetical protein
LVVNIAPEGSDEDATFKSVAEYLLEVNLIEFDEKKKNYRLVDKQNDNGCWCVPIAHCEDSPGWNDQKILVAPWNNGTFLNEISLMFLLSFFLGKIVRYYPSWWMTLLGGGDRDRELPLVMNAIRYIEDHGPKHILAHMNMEYRF